MSCKVGEVIELVEAVAPPRLACEGDPVGLHAGRRGARVGRILLALDATRSVIARARRERFQMILTHHPRFYRGMRNLDEDTREGALAAEVARAGIAIYCAHTNLDVAPGGVNDVLADLAGLRETRRPLRVTLREPLLKLAVFVPESHLAAVQEALYAAGAGCIGEYTECSYRVAGIGTFRPGEGANPFIGKSGTAEEVEEWRLEVILPASARPAVELALHGAHPYEEPAYDIFTLCRAEDYGLGRIGELSREATLSALARRLKKATGSRSTIVLGEEKQALRRIAVWGGGGVAAGEVLAGGAQALVCGVISYHEAELLQERGVGIIALGHGPSERPVLGRLAESLREGLPGVEVVLAEDDGQFFYAV